MANDISCRIEMREPAKRYVISRFVQNPVHVMNIRGQGYVQLAGADNR